MEDWIRKLVGAADPRTVIAHEVAHQWWGNLVGWESYRDQWISEALANYSSLLFSRDELEWDGRPRIAAAGGWTSSMWLTTERGLPAEAIGPVVLGGRLASSLDDEAYYSIVYEKGAVVFDTLARLFNDEALFNRLLHAVVDESRFHDISTEDLFEILERETHADLHSFTGRFVYGTGIPEIFYTYEIERDASNRWIVRGEAIQRSSYRYHHRVTRRADGSFDLARTAAISEPVNPLAVPLQIPVCRQGCGEGSAAKRLSRSDANVGGRLALKGERTEFAIPLQLEPAAFRLDPAHEVFSLFYTSTETPKKFLLYQALHELAEGQPHEAQAHLDAALEAPAQGEIDFSHPDRTKSAAHFEEDVADCKIHLNLARLLLDQDRLREAREHLKQAHTSSPALQRFVERELLVMEARADLRGDRFERVLRQLGERFLAERPEDRLYDAEAYALLAIAARATGDEEVYARAAKLARRFGVDLSALESAGAEVPTE